MRSFQRTVVLGLLLNAFSLPTYGSPKIDEPHSCLRSAFLGDAGVARYSQPTLTESQFRSEVQRHFEVVIRILQTNENKSIQTALERLQLDSGISDDNLAKLEKGLRENRHLQIRRLKEYAQAGKFPKNTSFKIARPIFVDVSNTACAVGHLMRCSGAHAIVENVRSSNNFVRLLDLEHRSATNWILRSGLTREEAALIQPTYGLIHGEDCAVIAGPSGSFNGEIGGEFVLKVVRDLTAVKSIVAVSEHGFQNEESFFPNDLALEHLPDHIAGGGLPWRLDDPVTASWISTQSGLGESGAAYRLLLPSTLSIEGIESSFGPKGLATDSWRSTVTGINSLAQNCLYVPNDLPNLDFEEGSTQWFLGNIDLDWRIPNQVPIREIESLGEATLGAVGLLSGPEAIEGQSAVLRGTLNAPAALMREHPSNARFVEFEYRGDRPTLVEHSNSTYDYEWFLPPDLPLFGNALELAEIEPGRLRAEISRGGLLGFHALEGETVIIDNVIFSVPESKFSNVVMPTLGILFLAWGRSNRKTLRIHRAEHPN